MVHSFHDRAEVVGRSEGDLDHVRRSHRRVQRLLVGGRENPGPVPQGVGLPQEPEEVPVPLEGTGKVVHDHTGVMHLQEGDEIEGAILDLCQERRGGRQTLAIEGRAEGVDELRVGVEDRHGRPCRRTRHFDRTFLAEPEAQKGTVEMSRPTTRTPVAIFNSHSEFVDALRAALDREGLPTATALLAEIQDGTLDLVAFLEVHDPRVIVYDLPRPFERHWNFLRLLRQTDALRNRTWILTTTDKKALDAAVGASDVIQIAFGAPYDLGAVVKAVHHALADVRPLRPESDVRRAPRGIAPAPVSIAQEAAAQLA